MDLCLPTGYDLRGPPLSGPTLVGFCAPTAYEARGSDLHRACLTRLRCASRLSQPPDASFLPGPLRLCFTPLTLLGFHPPEVFPPDPPGLPLGAPAPLDVPRRWSPLHPRTKPSDPCLCPERKFRSQERASGGRLMGLWRGPWTEGTTTLVLPGQPCRWAVHTDLARERTSGGGSEEPLRRLLSGAAAPAIPPRRATARGPRA